MDLRTRALNLHRESKGKLELVCKGSHGKHGGFKFSLLPRGCRTLYRNKNNPSTIYEYTAKGNLVGVVTDGTAVLGLGDIGPGAALPVMEGKAILLKRFANVDAFPICLDTKNVDEIVQIVKALSPTFGAINLEDISAPRCFEIEDRLRIELDIPVFHDDQHGTAIVVGAGLQNAVS